MRRFNVLLVALSVGACARPTTDTPGPAAPSTPEGGYDLVIEGGRIVDGSGNGWYPGDIGVRGDRIAAITLPGGLSDAPATQRVDVDGQIVAPGFIDIQSHSRFNFLGGGDGRVVSKVTSQLTVV